jgi:hypothetical protein
MVCGVRLVFFDKLLCRLHADIGLGLIIFLENLRRDSSKLAAQMGQPQHEGILLILSQRAPGAGKCGQKTDAHGLRLHR